MRASNEIHNLVRNTTNIKKFGVANNIEAIDHVISQNISGAIVECGVWKGGSMAAMLHRLVEHEDTSREIFLYDTFGGMTKPSEHDTKHDNPQHTLDKFNELDRGDHNEWCYGPLGVVKNTITNTNYPQDLINYVIGDVSKTLQTTVPESIAVLRIDVDFYEGTKSCMESLYPKVVKGGMVIFDDYAIWKGAKLAIDQYFEQHNIIPDLQTQRHIHYMVKK